MTTPRSLSLVEAAALLRVHKNTLAARARARIIPGAKIGKEWAFLEADLVAYMRAQYQEPLCPSTSKLEPTFGRSTSPSRVTHGYVDQLERLIASKRSASTTRSRQASGPHPS
ncbi:hypothetical protein DBR23_23460 [Acidovorax sp. HMWF018]|nr:hypothetical protein DBR23_23460 [Acidovorax sp. HMWF018]